MDEAFAATNAASSGVTLERKIIKALGKRSDRPGLEFLANWIRACAADDIEEEDLLGLDYGDNTYCIYHTTEEFFATDGICTHEDKHLENGIVIDCVIECPLHQGRFDVRNGKALSAPVCVDLKTWPVKQQDGDIYINIISD
jgi:3-phenylpropionate/trans-cinnamate dioxygenase ferredoxin subunit